MTGDASYTEPAMPYLEPLGIARAALIAASLSLVAPLPLLAQEKGAKGVKGADGVDRVELIMSGLPPQGSAEYNALIKHAGDAKGQVLPLTKREMWSVRPSLLKNLQTEASKRNVGVQVLDQDWNKVLDPMAAPMDAKSKSMMDQAMQSKSTSGVGMMAARDAGVVEYALTKEMSAKSTSRHPMTVRIAINDNTTITAVRRDVVIQGNRCIWRGVVEGTENPVTIMWWGSGRMTGTIHHGDRLYQLKQMSEGTIGIVETMTERMPDEHARTTPQRMRQMNMGEDNVYMKGDASEGRPRRDDSTARDAASEGRRSQVPNSAQTVTGALRALSKAAEQSEKPQTMAMGTPKGKGKGKGKAQPDTVIDLMVAYTAKAASNYGSITQDLIELAVEEAEESFRKSGIPDLKLRLVHVHQTDYDESDGEHFDHVWRMVDRDSFMEEIPRLRDEKKADVVILIVDDAKGCGLATRVAAEADEAYAVVHHECAATTFSLAHELGHLIGARHDRLLDKSATPFPYGHGFIDKSLRWRTMMSYKAGCNGCPRLPIWSGPKSLVNGMPAGDELHDNGRVLRENAARVAAFR
jgi:hypothetical protein